MNYSKKLQMMCVLLLLFFCCCKKTDGSEGQPIAPEPSLTQTPTLAPTPILTPTPIPELSPTPTPAPGAWFLEPAKNQEFDWTASSYDYACYIMELQTEENKVIINPVRWIFEFEEERWFAEGNQEELTTGYDVLDEEIDPVELAITKKTEFHMSPMPGDYAYSYVKEHCDRYFHGELVTSDPVLFKYYLQNFTEKLTQFFEEEKHNLVGFVILDTDGTVAYFIEGPRY